MYKKFKDIESIQFWVAVTDPISQQKKEKEHQLISAIQGLIDNNAEWAHVNLVKAQKTQLLSKYARSISEKELRWGFGSSRVEQ